MPLVELIAILVGVLVIVSPFISLALLSKYKKLRQSVDQLAEDNSRTHAALEKAVADLKRQLASVGHVVPPPTSASAAKPMTPVVPVAPVAPTSPVVREPIVVAPPEAKLPPPAPVAPQVTEKKPEAPSVIPKPEFPAAAKSPAEVKPSVPVPPPPVAPAIPSIPPSPPTPQIRVKPPAPTPTPTSTVPTSQPSGSGARISSPSSISPFRVTAPKPTFQQRMKTVSAIEEALGKNWLFKIGIIIFVLGVAFLGIYELGALGPLGKVGISYLASAVL